MRFTSYLRREFERDVEKSRKNGFNHRVLFTEAATVFTHEDTVYF